MVCAFGATLALAGVLYPFLRGSAPKRAACRDRNRPLAGVVLLAGSAILLVAAPRADQPLIDAIEYAVPPVRTLYFTKGEHATFRTPPPMRNATAARRSS